MSQPVMSKREAVRRVLSRTGLTELRWRTLGRGLYCFNYHRIGDAAACEFDRGVFSCSADRFGDHVALLKKRFRVIDIAELIEVQNRRLPRKPLALITFDDGYIDNYTLAFPVLKEFGVTAVFFIPTAFIGGSSLPWWDEIAWSLRNATVERFRLKGGDDEFDLRVGGVEPTISAVLRLVKTRRQIPMEEQVAEVREASRPAGSIEDAGAGLFVNGDQIREMRRAGMDIGSHTHSHRILSHLDDGSQRDELKQSKAILEGLLGEPVTSVAYPVGSLSAYGPETCRIAESLGYRVGFNFVGKVNRLPIARPFEVNRFAVDGDPGPRGLKSLTCFPGL
jgi:peptidoglycan/xylan/chitin deacetylase (PgdA/CDA1 family)